MSHLAYGRGLSLLSNGLFASTTLTVAVVTLPSLKRCKDPIPVFTRTLERGGKLAVSSMLVSSICHFYIYYKTRNRQALWCGLLSFISVPYSIVFLLPINKQILALDRKSAVAPPDAVANSQFIDLIAQWGSLHWFRVVASNVAFIMNVFSSV
ncbi:uncharacterized protein BX664DRAFT_320395 [Halteromyces radiatus]|uniref:uncharacterized protein n=1 Tax=Halteromyces radiatus TaxID=101107 RepID=UPI00221FE130|nr:uncharacterized protein BX664DRAFT_320395 [Halteromyces radiatus]KAI8099105.1 hypothetical protein BX664DRAFT_320395 [Halteromyces radiatus]